MTRVATLQLAPIIFHRSVIFSPRTVALLTTTTANLFTKISGMGDDPIAAARAVAETLKDEQGD